MKSDLCSRRFSFQKKTAAIGVTIFVVERSTPFELAHSSAKTFMSYNYKILPLKRYQRTGAKKNAPPLAEKREINQLLCRYTEVFFQSKNYDFEKMNMAPGFPSKIHQSRLHQLGLTKRECWRKKELRMMRFY